MTHNETSQQQRMEDEHARAGSSHWPLAHICENTQKSTILDMYRIGVAPIENRYFAIRCRAREGAEESFKLDKRRYTTVSDSH